MYPVLLTGLLWLAAMLGLFLAAQRWLHRQIHAILLMLTRRPNLALGLFSLVFFPGVFLHEMSHFLMARLLQVRTGRFSLLPKVMADATLRMGYVETARTDVLRDALIGTAPLLTGGAAVALIGIYQMKVVPLFAYLSGGQWDSLWNGLGALPDQPDFWLWFYLAFSVATTMLPSDSDRRAWQPILLWVALLTGAAALAGAGPWMLENLAPALNAGLRAGAVVFVISLGLHLLLWIPFRLLRALLQRVTGVRLVMR